jgi:lipopolysaccharide export system ATP-binding protein
MPLLEVEGLVKSYGRRRVVNGVSFTVDRGEVVGLLGPNGAGKTTSFRMTTGMVTPQAGKVTFAGQVVTNWPMYKRARLGMGYLSQESSIFRKLTVEQNILAVLEAMPGSRSLKRKLTRKERYERTEQVLNQFGLLRLRKHPAALLSGGEKRRLEIARCLVCEPLLILLDEPFTGIDPITIADIQDIVIDLRNSGIGLLLTDHNVREALKITDRSYVITDGVVEAHGTPDEIIRNPLVIAKYLGQNFADETIGRLPPRIARTSAGADVPRAASVLPPEADADEPRVATAITSRPAVRPAQPVPVVHHILEQERARDLIDLLKTEHRDEAERELLQLGRSAVIPLIEALERRDLEIRRMAFHVLQRLTDGAGEFDAYAPEAHRRQQIDRLRDRLLRRAG